MDFDAGRLYVSCSGNAHNRPGIQFLRELWRKLQGPGIPIPNQYLPIEQDGTVDVYLPDEDIIQQPDDCLVFGRDKYPRIIMEVSSKNGTICDLREKMKRLIVGTSFFIKYAFAIFIRIIDAHPTPPLRVTIMQLWWNNERGDFDEVMFDLSNDPEATTDLNIGSILTLDLRHLFEDIIFPDPVRFVRMELQLFFMQYYETWLVAYETMDLPRAIERRAVRLARSLPIGSNADVEGNNENEDGNEVLFQRYLESHPEEDN